MSLFEEVSLAEARRDPLCSEQFIDTRDDALGREKSHEVIGM